VVSKYCWQFYQIKNDRHMYQNTTKLLLNASDVSNMIIQEYVCTLSLSTFVGILRTLRNNYTPNYRLKSVDCNATEILTDSYVITPSINHVTVNPQSPCNLTLHMLLTLFLLLNCFLFIWKLSENKYNNIILKKSNECLYYKPTYIRIII
jgi:hypothetical protein